MRCRSVSFVSAQLERLSGTARMWFHPSVDCSIGKIAFAQCGVVFQDLAGIDTPGNHCRNMRARDAGAREYGLTAEYIGVGNDPLAPSVIRRQIVRKMTA